MPIAKVRLPDGRIARFQVPEGTTPEQVQAFAAERALPEKTPPSTPDIPSTKPPTLLERAGGAIDAAATLASGAVAEPLAGIAGIAAAIIPGGQTGAQAVETTKAALTRTPSSAQGRAQLATLGELAENIPKIGEPIGDFVFEQTGSAALAAAAATTPTLVAELLGLGVLRKFRPKTRLLDDLGRPTKALRKALSSKGLDFDNLSPDAKMTIPQLAPVSAIGGKPLSKSAAETALIAQIKSGGRDDALAGLRVDKGRVKPDKAGLEAVKQGFDPSFVQSIKTASPDTKLDMTKMLSIMRQGKSSRRKMLDSRPSDVTGDAITKQIRFIRDKADIARKELDDIVNKKLVGVDIDSAPILSQLSESLDKLDVRLVDAGTVKPGIEFKGSLISKDRTSQRVIRDMVDLLAEGGRPDAQRLHKLKRQLDMLIDFKKKSAGGLTDAGKGVLKDMRRTLNDSLRGISTEYKQVNDTLSKSLTALDEFQKVSGSAIDIFGRGANSAIGTDMRALMSNRKGRVNIENALDSLTSTAESLGGKFGGDVKDLVMFSDGIEDVFGSAARTSLKGELESAAKQAGQQGAAVTVAHKTVDAAAKKLEGLRGINDFNAFEAISELLSGGIK